MMPTEDGVWHTRISNALHVIRYENASPKLIRQSNYSWTHGILLCLFCHWLNEMMATRVWFCYIFFSSFKYTHWRIFNLIWNITYLNRKFEQSWIPFHYLSCEFFISMQCSRKFIHFFRALCVFSHDGFTHSTANDLQ